MCNFKEEITDKTQFTGYKVAIKRGGKYYSPITGIEYKPGLVKPALNLRKVGFNFQNVTAKDNHCHISRYYGMTAIFKDFHRAERQLAFELRTRRKIYSCILKIERGEIVMLKMTIQKTKTKNCWKGDYDYSEVFIGPSIRSIKEIKQY